MNLLTERGAGVLCHISSLPNKYGIGSLGKEAYEFADFLKSAHVKYWQILPLAQTGFGDSPYQSVCCNSGNPYFIDLEALKDEGLLDEEELKNSEMPAGAVNYGELYKKRYAVLRLAYARFDLKNPEFVSFVESGEFEDYAVFMSLKSRYSGTFDTFPDSYKYNENLAVKEFKETNYKSEYCFWQFLQFTFLKQWRKLKEYVNSLGISIIGDIPLYVAYDSADVWARPELFMLDRELKPTETAGVPPDYFSKTGQLWGNPLYNWEVMKEDGYKWWVDRIARASKLYDVLRLDHFRGLEKYYCIPAGSETAEEGEWKQGPAKELFDAVKQNLGDVPIIAEDLGILDEDVEKLKNEVGLPGMKIMLFAFDGKEDNAYLPANTEEFSVAYTGTHDNATALELLNKMTDEQFKVFKKRLRAALATENVAYPFVTREQAVWALCLCVLASPANTAVIPVQDLCAMGGECRMNIPSTPSGNWQFRLEKLPSRKQTAMLRLAIEKYNR